MTVFVRGETKMPAGRARFLAELLRVVRERAADEPADDRLLVLAAHLLAACEVLKVRETDVRCSCSGDPVRALLDPAARLDGGDLVAHLLALDALLGRVPVPVCTVQLTPVDAGGLAISGVVTCGPRGPRVLRDLRERLDHPLRWDRVGHALRHVQLWWQRPDELLGVRAMPVACPQGRPWALGGASSLRLLLAPLFGVSLPHLDVRPRGPGWGFTVTSAGARIPAVVRDRLTAVVTTRAIDLLVLPELLVTPDDHAWLRSLLGAKGGVGPRAVLGGSWHVGTPARNLAPLLDRRGPRLAHAKRGYFALRSGQVREFVARGGATVMGGALPDGLEVIEDIERGEELLLFETPPGRATVVVCADLLDEGDDLPALVLRVGPDLVFVLAMSETTDAFERQMRNLAHLGVTTLLVNAAPAARAGALVAACELPFRVEGEHGAKMWKGAEIERPAGPLADAFEWVEDVGMIVDLGVVAERAKLAAQGRPRLV